MAMQRGAPVALLAAAASDAKRGARHIAIRSKGCHVRKHIAYRMGSFCAQPWKRATEHVGGDICIIVLAACGRRGDAKSEKSRNRIHLDVHVGSTHFHREGH